jgi:hypothetical protein
LPDVEKAIAAVSGAFVYLAPVANVMEEDATLFGVKLVKHSIVSDP